MAHGWFEFLAKVDFESFFHRALLIAAIVLIWPLLRSIEVRNLADLGIAPNPRWSRHLISGFVFSSLPLLCCGALLVALDIYAVRANVPWAGFGKLLGTTVTVPLIEEAFFRGLLLGILLKSGRAYLALFLTSAFYSILHFLKAADQTSAIVSWTSGFNSILHSFTQFAEPMLVLAGFTTLFLIGWILGDARLRTRSLWLSIGLHAGWIFGNGAFNKIARREMLALPWVGKNLLVGIIPLGVACLTWIIIRLWLRHESPRKS